MYQLLFLIISLTLRCAPAQTATSWAINSLSLASGGYTIPSSGSFNVNVAYGALENAKVVVDILDSSYAWYGGGSVMVSSGLRTVSVTVSVQAGKIIPSGTLKLKAWIIRSADAYLANAWTYAKAERFIDVSKATSSPTTSTPTATSSPTTAPPAGPTSAPVPTGTGKYSTTVGSSYTRFTQFIEKLTTMEGTVRAVHSSGGAAGGVVSEGQGYGLFLAGATAASLGPSNTNYAWTLARAYELFLGWKKMCTMSASGSNCQGPYYCNAGSTPCLPHWKFNDALTSAEGTGSAPDGDEDAILGMILMVLATKNAKPTWWTEVAKWAYWSSKQFYESSTVSSSDGRWRIVKLGACWGGWDCNNPSYHAPAAYRAMRDFMKNYGPTLGMGTEGTSYEAKWNKVIETTYAVLLANQCDNTGLTTNWYVPNSGSPTTQGSTGCSGSGTPADQYGAEASRGVWRVALDWIWYGGEAPTQTSNYLTPIVSHLLSKNSGSSFGDLSTGCLVNSIHSSWTSLAFMYGPTFSALVFPTTNTKHAQALSAASSILSSASINDYYAGSWVAIATMTLNGDLAKLKPLLTAGAPTSSSVRNPEDSVYVDNTTQTIEIDILTNVPCSQYFTGLLDALESRFSVWIEAELKTKADATFTGTCTNVNEEQALSSATVIGTLTGPFLPQFVTQLRAEVLELMNLIAADMHFTVLVTDLAVHGDNAEAKTGLSDAAVTGIVIGLVVLTLVVIAGLAVYWIRTTRMIERV